MNRKFYIETYGCQMNVADSELVANILKNKGFELTDDYKQADLVLINTCAVRDKAEQRIIGRLGFFKSAKRVKPTLKVGVLGCMAQRMKQQLLDEQDVVDFVMGPDTYKRLPEILENVENGERQLDVILSKQETYDDIKPFRYNENKISGFVSISRGCNNMCAFCIVPFTRGRERSRDPKSILAEVIDMKNDGYKEVTLLGQNVDKYNWNDGEIKFANLLEMVAKEVPGMRVRFATSYPQDMTDEVLHIIANYENVCKYIHLPVQSGSNAVLETMKRGYTREWYLNRIEAIHRIIPECAISTDMISGFCGETEEDHQQTLDLMRQVKYAYAYMFKYSVRPNTFAARNLPDDVSEEDKSRRLAEIIELQNDLSLESNQKDVGKTFEVLVEGTSKRSEYRLHGRNSQNKVVIFEGDKSLIGSFVDVKIESHTQATLLGKLVSSCVDES
ncbi:MAG: tRNA (N6-isopentenyl adenosine(37)-C2)-methylthiotransferase MiaB [Bacteroidales bacterium]|nr:tRNA (N6-isopentenyl adenosine(37)-C2)-methylthiotransferase MiaB [Bacteroidales bacterium]